MSASNISDAIKAAIGSHGLWKGRLRHAIDTQTSEFEVSFVRSCHNCEFGKWLDGDKANLMHHSHYNEVYELHRQLHLITADIMELALSGDKDKAEAILGKEFFDKSGDLVRELMAWNSSLPKSA